MKRCFRRTLDLNVVLLALEVLDLGRDGFEFTLDSVKGLVEARWRRWALGGGSARRWLEAAMLFKTMSRA